MRISDWSSDVCSSDLRRGVDAHDHDRLIADFVDAVVAGLRDLVEARGDLPDFAPEFLELELRESGIDVTTDADAMRSEEHTSELQSLMRISYAVFCLKKKTTSCQVCRK